jgi:viroplasmin and RNaseH domain-containing protein
MTDTSPNQDLLPPGEQYDYSTAAEQRENEALLPIDNVTGDALLDETPQERAQFFALRQGRYTKSCIYIHEQDLLPQIDGFDGADYMSFDSWDKAYEYIQESRHPTMQDATTAENDPHLQLDQADQIEEESEWERRYIELVDYHYVHGTSDVPTHTDLGHFAARQRLEYKHFINNKARYLTQDRVDRLKEIHFCFGGQKDRKTFQTYVEELVHYRTKNEGRDPPNGSMLTKWISNMHKRYVEFKKGNTAVSGMDAAKGEILERLGFYWSNEDAAAVEVHPMDQSDHPEIVETGAEVSGAIEETPTISTIQLEELPLIRQHLTEVGTAEAAFIATAPGQGDADLLSLPLESHTVQHAETNIMENMRPTKKRKMDLMSDDSWDNFFEDLKQFKAKNGHCIPPVQPATKLRQWVDKVRLEYKKLRAGNNSLLTAQRIQNLNDIGFQFERKVKPRTWEQRFQELISFKENFGHCKVPRLFNQPSYEGLGKWVADQRMKYNYMMQGKKSNMTQERAQRLTQVGMVWSVFKLPPKEERAERKPWSHRYQELLKFQKQHGHTLVPQVSTH